KNELPKNPKLAEEIKGELDKKKEMQRDLAGRTDKLLDMMKSVGDKRAKDGDKEGAKKLEAAAGAGKAVPENMRQAADDLAQQKTNKAMDKQQGNVKTLEKMLAALEEKKDDDLERLQKKTKNAAEVKDNIDKLAGDQERLQKKVKDAGKIENPEER